jgi:hypothetical protein
MRFLFQLKCLALCTVILCLAHGRIHFYSCNFEKHLEKKVRQLGKHDRLYGEDENGNISLKRKHKPKGRPLAGSQITELCIRKACYYSEFNVNVSEGQFNAPVQKAHRKRGPPASSLFC